MWYDPAEWKTMDLRVRLNDYDGTLDDTRWQGWLFHFSGGITIKQYLREYSYIAAKHLKLRARDLINRRPGNIHSNSVPDWCSHTYYFPDWYHKREVSFDQFPPVVEETEGLLRFVDACEAYITWAYGTMERVFDDERRQAIILQMAIEHCNKNYFRAQQLGIYYNLIPELLYGNRKKANHMYAVIKNIRQEATEYNATRREARAARI